MNLKKREKNINGDMLQFNFGHEFLINNYDTLFMVLLEMLSS